MSDPVKSLGKHTLVYAGGIILGKIASFIMLPVYTRYLTPADYGVVELLGMTMDVIGMVAGIGLLAGIFKFYSEASTPKDKDTVVSTAALGIAGLALVSALVGMAAAPLLSRLILGPAGEPMYFRVFFLIYLLQHLEYVPLLLVRAQNRSVLFVAINATKLLAMLSLNIYFVVFLGMGVRGVMASTVLTSAVVGLVLSLWLVRNVGLRFSGARFKEMARFGSPVILWSLGTFVLVFSDRYFLNHYAGTAEVGIYSLAYKFAFVLGALAYSPFEMIWDPQRYEVARRPDAQAVYSRVWVYVHTGMGLAALGIALFVKDFLEMMSDAAFLPAYRVVPIILAAQIVFSLTAFCNLGLFLRGKMQVLGTGAFVAVVVTVGSNLLLIPRYGIHGAAWATLLAYSARFAWVYYFSQRAYRIQYAWAPVAKLYALLGVALALRFAIHPTGHPASLAWSAALLLAAVAGTYGQVLGAGDRSLIRAFAGRMLRTVRVAPAAI